MPCEPASAMEPENWTITRVPARERRLTAEAYVREGLTSDPKYLPPVLFYDERGSELFEKICTLEEYYPTRTERGLLEAHSADIAALLESEVSLVELGSGNSEKTQVLLAVLLEQKKRVRYIPIDISEAALIQAKERLADRFPSLDIHAIVSEYDDAWERIPTDVIGQPMAAFLGSNIGNLDPPHAAAFLRRVHDEIAVNGRFLLGTDLVKDAKTLERAYDDSEGVTAEFNLNVLARINRELNASFDLDAFEHRARWNASDSRIEMHLRSKVHQTVRIEALDLDVELRAGETIHTESSYKYTPDQIDRMADATGWDLVHRWVDDRGWFGLSLLARRA